MIELRVEEEKRNPIKRNPIKRKEEEEKNISQGVKGTEKKELKDINQVEKKENLKKNNL